MPAFFIISSQIVNIRQKELLNQLTKLNNQLKTNNQKLKTQVQMFYFWKNFIQINRHLVKLMIDIEKRANYFSSSLTFYFVGFIIIQCYVLYIVFFVQNLHVYLKLFLFYGLLLIEMFQFMLVKVRMSQIFYFLALVLFLYKLSFFCLFLDFSL